MTHTCPKCKLVASVEGFNPFVFTWDGVRTTTYICPRCGAIRSKKEKVANN